MNWMHLKPFTKNSFIKIYTLSMGLLFFIKSLNELIVFIKSGVISLSVIKSKLYLYFLIYSSNYYFGKVL